MKKIALVILLMIPFVINAEECNKEKHKEYINLSSNITYDNNPSGSGSSELLVNIIPFFTRFL